MQAPTELTLSYTPFTDANFTDAILLNVTNTAYTGAVPEGDLSCNCSFHKALHAMSATHLHDA